MEKVKREPYGFVNTKMTGGLRKERDKINFEFKLKEGIDGENEIEYISVSCGACTVAEYVKETNSIIGVLDLQKAKNNYDLGKTPINKNVIVFYNDGQPHFISGADKKMKVNPKKKKDVLTISSVVLKQPVGA